MFNCSICWEGNCTHFILNTKVWSPQQTKSSWRQQYRKCQKYHRTHLGFKTSSKLPKCSSTFPQHCKVRVKKSSVLLTSLVFLFFHASLGFYIVSICSHVPSYHLFHFSITVISLPSLFYTLIFHKPAFIFTNREYFFI